MKLLGKNYTKDEIKKYIGDISQIAGAKEYVLADGRANGVKAIDVDTGSGLVFTILPDRCMDIAWASYKGQSLTHITKTGIVSSKYFEAKDDNWFRSYFAGLLTTCGLRNTGANCEDEDEKFGLHGRIGNIPAEKVCIEEEWIADEYYISIKGTMREAVFYGENLTLSRKIKVKIGEPVIEIEDIVENHGYNKEPLFLLYHTNYGFPLIDENSKVIINSEEFECYDEAAEDGIEKMYELQKPTHNFVRQVFMHKMKSKNEVAKVAVVNEKLEDFKGVCLSYSNDTLPEFFQFKMMGETDYQLGLEPSNCMPMGRQAERGLNRLKYIEANSSLEFVLKFEILNDGIELLNTINDIRL
jgi:hypothetical protein